MFAQSMNPSREGMWTRVAPIAAVLAVATSFALSLMVLVSAVDASQTVLARAKLEQQQKASAQQVLVQNQATGADAFVVHGS